MKKEIKKRINICLAPSLIKKGKKYADKKGFSLSQLLAIGLKREIARKK